MVSVETESPTLKIYVSHDDSDVEFVDKLSKGLKRHGRFDVSVTPGQKARKRNWKSRIGALIADADTILFVLSPESAQSNVFVWEVEHANELSKRKLPILHRPLKKHGP